jgi:hypothetical protein
VRRRAGAQLATGLLVAAIAVAACGSSAGSASPAAAAAATPVATAPIAIPSLAASPAPSSGGAASALPMPSGAQVQYDAGLLGVLPASVGGVRVTEEAQSFAEATKDPGFVSSVDRAAFAIATSGSDLASGVVAHLRPGVYSDKMFADWRSSYDQGACSQAGGVVGEAESSLAGRTVYVTTCGGGLRVYHAYLPSKGVVVSLFSVGANDFGAQLMSSLQG